MVCVLMVLSPALCSSVFDFFEFDLFLFLTGVLGYFWRGCKGRRGFRVGSRVLLVFVFLCSDVDFDFGFLFGLVC